MSSILNVSSYGYNKYLRNHAKMQSHEEARDLMARAKDKFKGKPLAGSFTMFEAGNDCYELRIGWRGNFRSRGNTEGASVGVISPDNVFTFTVTDKDLRHNSNGIVMAIHSCIPIHVQRKATGIYTVAGVRQLRRAAAEAAAEIEAGGTDTRSLLNRRDITVHRKGTYQFNVYKFAQRYLRQEAAEIFTGLQIDLNTGKALNPRPTMSQQIKQSIDPEKRKEWLKLRKQFKYNVLTRIKLGAYDKILAEPLSSEVYRSYLNSPQFSRLDPTTDWYTVLFEAIRDNDPNDTFVELVRRVSTKQHWYTSSNSPNRSPRVFRETFLDMLKANSVELRKSFGVITL